MNQISSGIPIWKLSPKSLEKLQLKKFMGAVKWAYENSRFLRSLYDDAGLDPEDIRAMEDANSVPKVEKFMMRTIQRKDLFPYSDALCVPIDDITEFRQTSGATGSPIYQPDTWRDWEWWSECWPTLSSNSRTGNRGFITMKWSGARRHINSFHSDR